MKRLSIVLFVHVFILAAVGSGAARVSKRSRAEQRAAAEAEREVQALEIGALATEAISPAFNVVAPKPAAEGFVLAKLATVDTWLEGVTKYVPKIFLPILPAPPAPKDSPVRRGIVEDVESLPQDSKEIVVMRVSIGAIISLACIFILWNRFKAFTDCQESGFRDNVPSHAYLVLCSQTTLISCIILARYSDIENVAAFGLISQAYVAVYGGVADAAATTLERRIRLSAASPSSLMVALDNLQRARVILSMNFIWMFPLFWFGIPKLCTAVGITGETVALAARINLMSGAFMLQSSATFVCLWGRGHKMAVSAMLLLGNVIHCAASYYFIAMRGRGVDGSALGLMTSSGAMFFLGAFYSLYAYTRPSPDGREEARVTLSMMWWCTDETLDSSSSFHREFRQQFLNSVPIGLFQTAFMFIVALLGYRSLAAAVFAESVRRTFVGVFGAAAKTASALFCINVESGEVGRAQDIMNYGALFSVALWVAFGLHLYFDAHSWAQVFTQDRELQKIVESLLVLISFTGFGSAMQEFAGYMASGIGMLKEQVCVHAVVYNLLAIPVAYKLADVSVIGLLGAFLTLALADGFAAAIMLGVLSSVDLRRSADSMAVFAATEKDQCRQWGEGEGMNGLSFQTPPLLPPAGSKKTMHSPGGDRSRSSPFSFSTAGHFPRPALNHSLDSLVTGSWESQ